MSEAKLKICLWFDQQAEEAANFYVSIFKDAKLGAITRCGEAGPGPAGSVLTIEFELAGISFIALNGGPIFRFTEAISVSVDCADQAEVDSLWEKLSAGGQKSQCGWLKDKFGLSWQIVPRVLRALIGDPDPIKNQRVMQAMFQMTKLDIAQLQAAYAGV